MKKIDLKQLLPYIVAVVLFAILSFVYFSPLLEGKVVNQSDISSNVGAGKELRDFEQKTGEVTLWTNSMFSGMPTVMISSQTKGNYLEYIYNKMFIGPRPASYILLTMVSFFLLMLAFGVSPWLGIIGSIAFAFCAYNFQLIQVGHNTKMVAIALMPMVLAGLVYAYQKNALLGALFWGIALTFEIMASHPQITFYLGMIALFYVVAQLYTAIKNKTLPLFLKTSILILLMTALAAGSNVNHLWQTWEYSKYTMRGGSELKEVNRNAATQTKSGLDKEYATTSWSYGIDETANLLIPDFKGGASSGALSEKSETYKMLKQGGAKNAEQMIRQMPTYWGEQAFTAGPMYMGAIAVFLFILGLVLIKGPMKWWIAAISLLALLLGWGRHFMWLSNLFYDHVPLYSKFRVPSMILVILQLTIPLLGFYTVDKIFKEGYDKKALAKGLKIAGGITAGFCALFVLMPGIAGNFVSPADAQFPEWLRQTLPADRRELLRADAIRSLIYILLAMGVVWFGYTKKLNLKYSFLILGLLVLADMWTIDKRYMNNDNFVTPREFNNIFTLRPVDKEVLRDPDPNYRVLDLSVNTFNDSHVSYHHKTIGGYSPAKLQRYQDIIEYHISPEIQSFIRDLQQGGGTMAAVDSSLAKQKVLNMLNTKYIIVDPNSPPIDNRFAYGNAWFVKDYELAETPDQEIMMLKVIDPLQTAIIGKDFAAYIKDKSFNFDEAAKIKLRSYAPNRLEYTTQAANEQLAVFSEMYYPKGWKASIDGNKADLLRTDYILRGIIIPAGEHTVVLEYKPESYYKGAIVSGVSSSVLLLVLVGCIVFYGIKHYKKSKEH